MHHHFPYASLACMIFVLSQRCFFSSLFEDFCNMETENENAAAPEVAQESVGQVSDAAPEVAGAVEEVAKSLKCNV